MDEKELSEIESRAIKAHAEPLELTECTVTREDYGEECLLCYSIDALGITLDVEELDTAVFIISARSDVLSLVSEVRRLREVEDNLRRLVDRTEVEMFKRFLRGEP